MFPYRPSTDVGTEIDRPAAPSASRGIALGPAAPNLGSRAARHKRPIVPYLALPSTHDSGVTPCVPAWDNVPRFGRSVVHQCRRPDRAVSSPAGTSATPSASVRVAAPHPLGLAPLLLLANPLLLRGRASASSDAGASGRRAPRAPARRAAPRPPRGSAAGFAARWRPPATTPRRRSASPAWRRRAPCRRRRATVLRATFQSSSIRVLDVFTCWPPAPPARMPGTRAPPAGSPVRRSHLQRSFLAHRVTPLVAGRPAR